MKNIGLVICLMFAVFPCFSQEMATIQDNVVSSINRAFGYEEDFDSKVEILSNANGLFVCKAQSENYALEFIIKDDALVTGTYEGEFEDSVVEGSILWDGYDAIRYEKEYIYVIFSEYEIFSIYLNGDLIHEIEE